MARMTEPNHNMRLLATAGMAWIAFLAGCQEPREPGPMPNPDSPIAWMDREDICEVVFHPRAESVFDARPAQGTELAIPVSSNITIGARFYPADKADPVILFFHGNGEVVADYDTVAAFYTQREDLLAAAGSTSKVLLKIPDGDHNNLLLVGRNAYMAAVSNLVKKVTK
jgi:hypothetical protein